MPLAALQFCVPRFAVGDRLGVSLGIVLTAIAHKHAAEPRTRRSARGACGALRTTVGAPCACTHTAPHWARAAGTP